MRIDLLRHGETEGGARYRGSIDDKLTARGWEEMEEGIAGSAGWDQIISSPLSRCARFAKRVAVDKNISLLIEPRLQEIHFGEWEGMTAEEIYALDPSALIRFWNDPAKNPPPGGERLDDFVMRITEAWKEIAELSGNSLVVCHGGTIRIIRGIVEQVPVITALKFDVGHGSLHTVLLKKSPCAVS